jgi:hypothetical protein
MRAPTFELPRRSTFGFLSLALALAAAAASPAAAQDGSTRTTLDGVYTLEQAELGAKTYEAICSKCHATGAALKGPGFLRKWSNQSLYRLWEYMSTRMPYGAPGTLQPEQYLGMLAWILQQNGFPAGDTPLPDDNLNGVYYAIGQINMVDPAPKSK